MKRSYQYVFGIFFVMLMFFGGLFLRSTLLSDQHVIELMIINKQLVSPQSPIVVDQGDMITFLIKGDEDEQFHLEGYHAFISYKAGKVTALEVEALTPGSFSFVLDKSKTYIGELVVKE